MNDEIFMNYRSGDEPFAALLIDRYLSERFGRGQVFRDSWTIPPGTYFPDRIWQALRHCRALVAIIGSRWLSRGPDGRRLVDDPRDYVRREIAVALRRDILVVPVLIGDVRLPSSSALPADIAGLARRQYLHLRARSAENDVSRLVTELADLLGGVGLRAAPGAAGDQPGAAAWLHHFHAPVDAPSSVLGTAYYPR